MICMTCNTGNMTLLFGLVCVDAISCIVTASARKQKEGEADRMESVSM